MKIAIQGVRGSFHHAAATRLLGPQLELLECQTFGEVVRGVISGAAVGAVLAIENNQVGSILPNYALLQASAVHIAADVEVPIHHYLMAMPGVALDDLREVRSHPMALSQCEAFLDRHPHWSRIEANDTAGSAQALARARRADVAAIAPRDAAEIYGLTVLAERIETTKHNATRFLLLRPGDASLEHPGARLNLSFSLANHPGSLHRALGVFAAAGWNLSKLQSVPIPEEPGHYRFFADLTIGGHGAAVAATMEEFGRQVAACRILGRY